MVVRGQGPWLISAGLHLGLGCLVLFFLSLEPQETPQVLRMRLVSPGGTPNAAPSRTSAWVPPGSASQASNPETGLPAWRPVGATPGTTPSAPVPVSLDELLPAMVSPSSEEPSPAFDAGWRGPGGQGYSPPPLPPPRLAPPQGAEWALVLSIPAGGGFALSFEGLDSGHPDLDQWLEEYLRTVSFPPSPDGEDYTLRWNLRLETGRPR